MTPTISTCGATNDILLITDSYSVPHRIPKHALDDLVNSGNGHAYRLEVHRGGGMFILEFESAAEVNQFVTDFEAIY